MRRAAFVCGSLLALGAAMRLPAADQYEIGAGDTVAVQVLGQADLSGEFRVDGEGLITYPHLGKIRAAGHTVADLERKLTTLLADGYLKRPQVTASIKEYGSQKIYVMGEVTRPGVYALKADRSLLALLGELGTLGPNAGHEVLVIRPAEEAGPVSLPVTGPLPAAGGPDALPFDTAGAEVFRISLQELQSGNPERNILLRPGDTLLVPKASQVYVTGSVSRPGPYRFQEGMTVLQAVTLAGGVTERGSTGRIKIIRVAEGKKQEFKARLTELVKPEDTLVVSERLF